jgi:MFS family permease
MSIVTSPRTIVANLRGVHRAWWTLLVMCVMLFSLAAGQVAIPVLYKSIAADNGWSRVSVAGAASLAGITMGVGFVLAGMATDRFGPQRVIPVFAVLHLSGYLTIARSTELWHLYIGMGVLASLGFSVGVAPMIAISARWFEHHRGLALGIVVSAAHVGFVVLSPVTSLMNSSIGWRWTMVSVAIFPFVVMLLAALVLRRSPAEVGLSPFGAKPLEPEAGPTRWTPASLRGEGVPFTQAMRRRELWVMAYLFASINIGWGLVMLHLVSYATDKGLSLLTAAGALSTVSVATIAGRLLTGVLVDRIAPWKLLALTPAVVGTSLVSLGFVSGVAGFYVFAAFLGFFVGGHNVVGPFTARIWFGEASLGAIMGALFLAGSIGGATGGFLGGATFDWAGSYVPGFFIAAGIAFAASLAILKVRRTIQWGPSPDQPTSSSE